MRGMPSVMNPNFARTQHPSVPRSIFNRSFGHKTTFDSGYLIPIFVDEALPGDTFNMRMHAFGRLATPLKPIMDNLHLETFFFAVPYRLVWENWVYFMGEQDNPGDSTDFVIPQFAPHIVVEGSISDYMGLPISTPNDISYSCLWHRAYNLIFNEWFRNENLQNSVPVPTDDGLDDIADYTLLRRTKKHDYFTSCLPFPQKGDDVTLPLGEYAEVVPGIGLIPQDATPTFDFGVGGPNAGALQAQNQSNFDSNVRTGIDNPVGSQVSLAWNQPGLLADLSTATVATINSLRESFQAQRFLERDARGGTRYTEMVRSHFGVLSADARLQRPEFLGGGYSSIHVHPVPQTSPDGDIFDTPQGNLAAFGTTVVSNHKFIKTFTEHCLILGLANVRADLTYQKGIQRMFSRTVRGDFYFPVFAHLGEQEVFNKEIFSDGTPDDNAIFGYQERYAEYRYKDSVISGLFRSEATNSLDFWHLSEDFLTRPLLNSSFIESDPPVDRVISVPSEPHIIMDMFFDLKCTRPLPTYSVPGWVDHF